MLLVFPVKMIKVTIPVTLTTGIGTTQTLMQKRCKVDS